MDPAASLLDALARRRSCRVRLALVVAHPDDETIAAGGSLHLLPGLLLVHVTDGAPRWNDDAARRGLAPEAYAAAREAELVAALAVAGFRGERRRLAVPDGEAVLHLRTVAEALTGLLAGTEIVLSHAYEGGHPDHDAVAWAVHAGAARRGIPVLEFPTYQAASGHFTPQRFLPGPAETAVTLPPRDAARKRAALDRFETQADTLEPFDAGTERFRLAAPPDWGGPPHEGPLNYERWGWPLTGTRWREHARDAACAG